MKYRKLGKTSLEVSEIGYGAWGLGGGWWGDSDRDEAVKALNLAIDNGVNFIDSALGYEESEEIVGEVIRSRSEKIHVSSKIPPKNFVFPAKAGTPISEAYPTDWIIECTEKSLKNNKLDCIDIQLFHVWINEWAKYDEWREAARKLKEQGKIKHFGASINFPYNESDDGIVCMDSGDFEVCEIVYNIYEQNPNKDILPAALKNNVAIIARCPLDEGALTGKVTPESVFPEGTFLDTYFKGDRKQIAYDKAQALMWLVNEGHADSLAQAALRFCLSHDAVSTVIAGMRKSRYVPENCGASDAGPLTQEILERLKEHAWDKDWWV